MNRRRAAHGIIAIVLSAATCLTGCDSDTEPLTQIVVVVDSDLRVPAELDRVAIQIDRTTNSTSRHEIALADVQLPLSLGLVHSGGPYGPIDVSAVGISNGKSVAERSAKVYFTHDATLKLELDLTRRCLDKVCLPGRTCVDGECQDRTVSDLPPFAGLDEPTPSADGGAADGGAIKGDAGDSGVTMTTNLPPVCAITMPADAAHFAEGEAIRFVGACSDPEGELLYLFRWRSDLDGLFGYWDFATENDLRVGTHVITLCATDPHGSLEGCAHINIVIDAAASVPQ
ncbi:MAG: hypothetical protein RL701_230 [Pseudomonadota bacterium]|jgi:hypothetical protein